MALPAGRYGVTKNQLLKIKKLPMNTIKLIEDLYEKYSLLGSAAFKNSTSVVTESSDLVESGAVYTALQAQGVVGAQNLLEVTANSGESKGVTFTVDNEKEITCNGTTSGEGTFYIVGTGSTDLISIPEIWKGKRLRLTGCPSGGSDNSYRVRFAERSPNTIWHDDSKHSLFAKSLFKDCESFGLDTYILIENIIIQLLFTNAFASKSS